MHTYIHTYAYIHTYIHTYIHIQDSSTKETFTGHPKTDVTCIAYSVDGGELATTAGNGSIKLWGGQRGRELMEFLGVYAYIYT